jgi:hypothetical protein
MGNSRSCGKIWLSVPEYFGGKTFYEKRSRGFTFLSSEIYKSKFCIYNDVTFDYDVCFATYCIPSYITFKKMIVNSTTNDFIILNDYGQPMYYIISNCGSSSISSKFYDLDVDIGTDISSFNDVLKYVNRATTKPINKKINEEKVSELASKQIEGVPHIDQA